MKIYKRYFDMVIDIDEYKYKIELHAHTSPCSRCSGLSCEDLVRIYKDAGVDAVVITNHLDPEYLNKDPKESADHFLDDYYKAKELGDAVGLTIILGFELRVTENMNDYLVYGVDRETIERAVGYIGRPFADFYRDFKTDKNVICHAHPMRDGMTLLPPDSYDGIEVFNFATGHNSRVGKAARYANEHNMRVIIAGSDVHDNRNHALALMRSKTLPKDSYEMAQILLSGDYLFDFSGNVVIPSNFCRKDK